MSNLKGEIMGLVMLAFGLLLIGYCVFTPGTQLAESIMGGGLVGFGFSMWKRNL